MRPAIRSQDVWKTYGADGERAGVALRGANLDVFAGELVALLGKSGSGKTTFLNIIAGLDKPSRGTVEIDGVDIEALGEKGRTILRRHKIGFVFQFFNLLPTLTAFENVSLSLELAGKTDSHAVIEALGAVNLAGKEHRFPHELSGGEQQRVAVARALVKKPAIVLADEPTGNLDTATGTIVLDLLTRECRKSGTTLIMVSHSLATCRYTDRILRMQDGVLTEEETCGEPAR